jgi:hypothetical protein
LPTARTRKVHNLTLVDVVSFPDAAEALLEKKSPPASAVLTSEAARASVLKAKP